MPCFSPLKGYRAKDVNPSGKRSIVFNPDKGFVDRPVKLPCGQCVGCRLERSRQWAVRCVHEAQSFERNSYITLTFDNNHLPDDYSVCVRDHQLFMHKLRKHVRQRTGAKIKFFLCGEYGDINRRPHYHALIFNYQFSDLELWKQNANGDDVFRSETLDALWGQGFCTVGEVSFESAAYVARYVMKKRNGDCAEEHYTCMHPLTGEIVVQTPEYLAMSRGEAIGKRWLKQYPTDVYPDDFVVLNGKKFRPPRWYDTVLEKDNPKLFREIKRRRKLSTHRHAANNTPARLRVREVCQRAKLERLKREL